MSGARVWKAWLVAALAVGYLAWMFEAGTLPEYAHYNEFEASGLLSEPPESVTRVTVARAAQVWRLQRRGDQWVDTAGDRALPDSLQTPLTESLRFLHRSAPVRTLDVAEPAPADLRAYGLGGDALVVVLANDSGVLLQFELGGAAPDGILRYLRATGRPGILLMSGFIGTAWDRVASALAQGGVPAEEAER